MVEVGNTWALRTGGEGSRVPIDESLRHVHGAMLKSLQRAPGALRQLCRGQSCRYMHHVTAVYGATRAQGVSAAMNGSLNLHEDPARSLRGVEHSAKLSRDETTVRDSAAATLCTKAAGTGAGPDECTFSCRSRPDSYPYMEGMTWRRTR